jgi:hypothetical protein
MEVWVDEDERTCPICAKHEGERVNVNENMPVPFHPNCRCCMVPVIEQTQPAKEVVEDVKNDNEKQEEIRRRREAYHRRNAPAVMPNFESMTKKEIEKWSKEHLKTNVDFKGATAEAARIAARAIKDVENQGIDIGGAKVVFGGTNGHYGGYSPQTNTIHLSPRISNKQDEEQFRSLRKLGIKRFSVDGYRGTVLHEIGHAIDQASGYELSMSISKSDDLISKSRSISSYSRTTAAYGMHKASETTAENLAAYLDAENRQNVSQEVKEAFDKYFKKKKKN